MPCRRSRPIVLRPCYSSRSTVNPPLVPRLNLLAENLLDRPIEDTQNRIIAVDGLDRNAVQLVIAELHHAITRELKYPVRVINEILPSGPSQGPADMADYLRHINNWAAMWNVILHTPPLDAANQQQLCVWIMPLSPLMVTTRASIAIALRGGSADMWAWLASHWAGHLRPDITINVQDVADTSSKQEVLRFEGNGMDTLIVTISRDGGILFTPSQLSRMNLEVKEWIQADH
ncbi:slightly ste11-like protein [Lecanora helva]